MKSTEFLQAAVDVQAERGKQYDSPEGERSMGRTVQAFNAITGRDLTEAEGWLLLQVLKDVRQWQNPGQFHLDSALDCVAYASLKGEALSAAAEHDEAGVLLTESPISWESTYRMGGHANDQAAVLPSADSVSADGWETHHGRGCPTGLAEKSVFLRRFNGAESGPHLIGPGHFAKGNDWHWREIPNAGHIVAYRLA